MDHVGLYHQIVVDEFTFAGTVGDDAPHPCGSQKNVFRLLGGKKGSHSCLIPQIQF